MIIQFKITNMTCESCVKINEMSLMDTAGVKSVKVDLKTGVAAIEYDETIISEKKIKEIVTNNGYGVV